MMRDKGVYNGLPFISCFLLTIDIQCLEEKLAISLSGIRKAAVVFILDELQKSLIHDLKELEICHNLQH